MIKGQNIICISSIDWDFIWQGHQEIMSAFAKNGNKVLFIENTGVRSPGLKDVGRLRKRLHDWLKSARGFREERENLFIYSPMVLPFPHSNIARWINKKMLVGPLKRWMRAARFYDPIIWTFLPTGTALDIINGIDKKLLIYYCIADFSTLTDNPAKMKRSEDKLIAKCDIIFAQGEMLKKRCEDLNRNVHIFPFGVNIETFERFGSGVKGVPGDTKDIPRPIVGYIGGIHRHIDLNLIKKIAQSHPEWSIVMVGPAQTDVSELKGVKNVHLLGKKGFEYVPAYISAFDVCIIPYQLNEYTETVFPTKLNEYHAMGKTVVSTALPEVLGFNKKEDDLVLIGRTAEEFGSHISQALAGSAPASPQARIASAKKNDWRVRIEAMSSFMERALSNKAEYPVKWAESFLKFYKTSHKRIAVSVAAILGAYLLIFYTPVVWLAAEPLVISQEPKNADAIVVFAGGVGESGRAGQGYEERVKYAVELYEKGYSKHMIFSSGFMHTFREPLVMEALAVSLGVPKEAIILEVKAKNTYENVEFTKRILLKNGFNSILLISSPYNMRRVELVFNKSAGKIDVIYVPVKNSLFYLRPDRRAGNGRTMRKINYEQISGILHEYAGIIYYWFKGFI